MNILQQELNLSIFVCNTRIFMSDIRPYIISRNTDRTGNDIGEYPGGIVIPVDKPYRWTSADVIRKIKYAAIRHFGKKNLKVGHAGTLDPLATGILLVCIGNATKMAERLQSHDKEYIAGISFGATTPSYDLEKDVDRMFPYAHITAEAIRKALPRFIGEQEQVAPLFSAKSVDGVRAYELARKLYRKSGQASMDGGSDRAIMICDNATSREAAAGNRRHGEEDKLKKDSLQEDGEMQEGTHKNGLQEKEGQETHFDYTAKSLLRTSIITISEAELLDFRPAVKDLPYPEEAFSPDSSNICQRQHDCRPGTDTGPSQRGANAGSSQQETDSGPSIRETMQYRQQGTGQVSNASGRINVADTSYLGLPHADIRITCSKGTYIRAFARDLGEALGSGAHLDSLRRTRSGDFTIHDAVTIEHVLDILG